MTPPPELVVLGAGGFAREALCYVISAGVQRPLFVDETAPDGTVLSRGGRTFEVINDWRQLLVRADIAMYREFIVAVGSPVLKRKLVAAALAHGLHPSATLIHEHAHIYGADVSIGRGGIIAPGCRLTEHIAVGDYVSLGINCVIGHDAVLGDYVTCNPGCQVSGNVVLGNGVVLGTGTSVRERITVADDVIVGAQACVVKSITERGITVAGVPARLLHSAGPES